MPISMLIPLTQHRVAVVDYEDWLKLRDFKWSYADSRKDGRGYAVRVETVSRTPYQTRTVYMHKEVLSGPVNTDTDHVNEDKLDSRRSNLRVATKSQNAVNRSSVKVSRSGFKGVHLGNSNRQLTWFYEVSFEGKSYREYGFHTPELAARARDLRALELHGEFAVLNFPQAEGV